MSITDLHCLLAGVNFEMALFGQEVRSTLFPHPGIGVLITADKKKNKKGKL